MTIELLSALVVIALGIVQVAWQAMEYRRVHGVAYANTAQDVRSAAQPSVLLGRLTRALRNLHETLPFFLGVVVILHLIEFSSPLTRGAAALFAAMRILYLPLYAAGIPYLRGLVWTVSFGALIALVAAAFGATDWAALSVS